MRKIEEMRRKCFVFVLLGLISLSALSVSGCAGRTKTSTVTTETSSGVLAPSTTTSVITQKEVETSAHPRGVIGGTFYVIGQVLLWPFKAIGSLFS